MVKVKFRQYKDFCYEETEVSFENLDIVDSVVSNIRDEGVEVEVVVTLPPMKKEEQGVD